MKPGDLVKFGWCQRKVGIVTRVDDTFILVRWGNGTLRWEDFKTLEVVNETR
jgi:hypothetical protein